MLLIILIGLDYDLDHNHTQRIIFSMLSILVSDPQQKSIKFLHIDGLYQHNSITIVLSENNFEISANQVRILWIFAVDQKPRWIAWRKLFFSKSTVPFESKLGRNHVKYIANNSD
jgi:hypothetical protein